MKTQFSKIWFISAGFDRIDFRKTQKNLKMKTQLKTVIYPGHFAAIETVRNP